MNDTVTTVPDAAPTALTSAERWRLRWHLWQGVLRECLIYDCQPLRWLAGLGLLTLGLALYHIIDRRRGFAVLAKLHRAALSPWTSRYVERLLRGALQKRGRDSYPLVDVLTARAADVGPTPATARYFSAPERLLGSGAMVLKSPGPNERGVLALYYSYTYPIFAKFFDLTVVAERYFLVLEPSWSGFCDENILLFTRLAHPVFVGSIEPRDSQFLLDLAANLVPVHFSSNTWVDPRTFRPLPQQAKEVDIVMVAAWASYKRHWALFRALRCLRRRGSAPSVALVGYPLDLTRDAIFRQAKYYGVHDQVRFHENLSPDEVNRVLSSAKVNLLWSRREGVNRAIIEGMLADVPCLVREGLNFGFRYPHINAQTGRFASEASLPGELADIIEHYQQFSPRDWVLRHLSPQVSAARLNEAIRSRAIALGESWTRDAVAKTNTLHGMQYWDPEDAQRFEADYDFLRSLLSRG